MQRVALGLLTLTVLAGCNPGEPNAQQGTQAATEPTAAPREANLPDQGAAAADSLAMTCDYPVRRGMSAAQVLAEFGKEAKRETLTGAQGIEYPAIVLWGRDPARRLELPFDPEDHDEKVSSIELGEAAQWHVSGLRMGDPLAKVIEVNGKPFRLWGFDWDYGGGVSNWNGGKLAASDGCGISVAFRPGEDAKDDYAMGDSEFSADDPRVGKAKARISKLGVVLGDLK